MISSVDVDTPATKQCRQVTPEPAERVGATGGTAAFRALLRNRLFWLVSLSALLAAIAGTSILHPARRGLAISAASQQSRLPAIADITVLVLREGLECVLVLAAITASFRGAERKHWRPVAAGVGLGFIATLLTWQIAVRVLNALGQNISALAIQAATGLLAVLVLLVVMNWFFHKTYWTGWISHHNQRKKDLLENRRAEDRRFRVAFGMALLGFTSFYREGFEVVLFLQGFRLKFGSGVVLSGVVLGTLGSGIVALLTFVAHRCLPYRRMLVLTGVTLGLVLLVMVGEQAQEMQLARWLPTTRIPMLANVIPSWMGTWFSIFPTVETLAAQALAALLVLGSYAATQYSGRGGSVSRRFPFFSQRTAE